MFYRVGLLKNKIPLRKELFRTFLSEEFKCTSDWEARLNAPFMQKIKLETFYYDIEQTLNNHGKASAIDIDLFVNKLTPTDEVHFEELSILLNKFRLTDEATNILDSTGHAVVRNFMDAGHIQDLMNILDHRLEYGVFLDHYVASYLLDFLIERRDFLSAARVAAQLMLQEDFDNELSKSLALFACYKYLDNPESFNMEPKLEEDENEPKEEKKVRVKFIRNEFFDDHFDLKNHYHIVGKTLIAISKTLNNELKESVNLVGNLYYEKYDKCLELLNSGVKPLHKDALEKCLKHLEKLTEENKELESNDSFNNLKTSLSNVVDKNEIQTTNFSDVLEKFVKEITAKHEKSELEKQKSIYRQWNENRQNKLDEEIERLKRAKRIKEVEKITQEMQSEEQKLWFFENEDKIDLQIDSKIVTYPKRWFGKKKKPRVVDVDYIPPEIIKTRK